MSGRFDVDGLRRALGRELRGTVASDSGSRGLYAVDGSNYRVVPELVVVPADQEDLAVAVSLVAAAGAPVVLRGGGTSMAGNAIGGVVIDASRHVNRIVEIDAERQRAVVEPGVVLTDLLAAAKPYGLAFGADPSSGSRATMGGMIANNACGAHSVAWGTTADNVLSLDLVLADGSLLTVDGSELRGARAEELSAALRQLVQRNELLIRRRFGQFSRQISGYALQRLLPEYGFDVAKLLSGTEGGFAGTLQATVALTPLPAAKVLCVLGFADSIAAADCVPVVLRHRPLTMESINSDLVERLPQEVREVAVQAGLPAGRAWLLVEVGGVDEVAAARSASALIEELRDSGSTASLVSNAEAQAVLWRCRTDAAGLATRRADGAEAWGGWEDAAVPPERLGAYLRGLDQLLARRGLSGASYGHFGEGCMHMRIDFDLLSGRGLTAYREFVFEATELVVELGGSVSGEHGDGRARSELLARMYGADGVRLFGELKRIWDPALVMNPGMVVDPPRLDADIRHQGVAKDRKLLTMFDYPDDGHDFAQAQRRCVGIGKCRQSSGGVMCPSYQVTRDELHSTRGRAHLLWEMLEGELITDGWRSTEVRDALDLCLSCKGCQSDCPVNVDMAKYKAEFTHHHYAGRPWRRPLSHWSMGWLPLWSRLAASAPGVANRFARLRLVKLLGGIASQRDVPPFASESFTTWFIARGNGGNGTGSDSRGNGGGTTGTDNPVGRSGRVVLWPDTFTNYLAPEVGRAAVEVLEAAGYEVVLPDRGVCCGLTWVSTGQLGMAKRIMKRSLKILAPHLTAGTPIVGLEPSCTAALRQDLPDLLPANPLAASLASSTQTFSEFLSKADWKPPYVGGSALVQTHCHQHAVLGFDADRQLMKAAGIAAEIPDAGCCGLAGNFGFERDHYALSKAIGERALLPAVRKAPPTTPVLADGFSCRTQITHSTTRRPLHLAQLLAAALPPTHTTHPVPSPPNP
ncbi:FAD-binding and (Fe-S)-binding domain-containing protein [Kribbella sp. NPDC006257]|uniref:FAD-binding and (Fe-S)-binding domain-containing protein n=1 Tax=Kribbella sp. NPDC006257 TaxID=3156738 RepID=UPI0033AB913D